MFRWRVISVAWGDILNGDQDDSVFLSFLQDMLGKPLAVHFKPLDGFVTLFGCDLGGQLPVKRWSEDGVPERERLHTTANERAG